MLDTKLLSEDLQKFISTNVLFWDTSKDNFPLIQELYDSLIQKREQFKSRIIKATPNFLYGIPIIADTGKITADTRPYLIAAVDGSQVESEDLEYQSLPFFILNIGTVLIDYPEKKVNQFESHPNLYDMDKIDSELNQNTDFLTKDFNTLIPVFRTKKEFEQALLLMDKLNPQDIVILDGGLIQWHLQDKTDDLKDLATDVISKTIDYAEKMQIHIVGFISGTKSSDVLGSLRILHCTQDGFDCIQCQDELCHTFYRLTDDQLFREILPMSQGLEWQVSPLFESVSSILSEYNGHRIFFFYVYDDKEFARIECAEHSLPYLNNIINSIFDQLKKGFGYPVVLQEAHELAVITKGDRLVLDQFLHRLGNNKNQINPLRLKNVSKRVKYI